MRKKNRPTPEEFLRLCESYPPIEVLTKVAPHVSDLREDIKTALKKVTRTRTGLLYDEEMTLWDWMCQDTNGRPYTKFYSLLHAAERNLRRLNVHRNAG